MVLLDEWWELKAISVYFIMKSVYCFISWFIPTTVSGKYKYTQTVRMHAHGKHLFDDMSKFNMGFSIHNQHGI